MTDNYLVVDVETLPLASSLEMPYPAEDRQPPANYSKPDTIAAWRVKDTAAWQESRVKECSLSPQLGRICCLGWKKVNGLPDCWAADAEQEERTILEKFWGLMSPDTCLVTFNGSFDLRFIVVRSLVNRVDIGNYSHVRDWFKRYSTWPHFDVRAVLTGWDDRQSGKLHEWAQAFGLPVTDTTSGADIYELAQAGEWAKIGAHCRSDVDLTDALYQRIAPMFT